MRKWPIRKILLIWSIIFYLLPLIDSYLVSEKVETKSLHNLTRQKLPGRGARLYAVNLEDNTAFRIHQSAFNELNDVDSCNIHSSTLLNKIKKISFVKGDDKYLVSTGFFNTGGIGLLIIGTVFFLLCILLLYTKKLNHLQMADFGPYVLFAFLLMYLFFYLTTD